MENRRQAFRREPIEVDLGDDRVIKVDPLPWEARNDFGNEVVRQHTTLINEAVRLYVDEESGAPQVEAKLAEKFTDARELFKLGLSPEMQDLLGSKPVFENQVIEVLIAILDVNNLVSLKALIDPNSNTPTLLGGLFTDLIPSGTATPKIESGPASSSPVLVETPSDGSPIPSSS